jgi:geranylgeranyl pyrophosphate synthase
LTEAGEELGLAFQIRDDLLDVTQPTEVLGKPALSDIKNNKATYVSIFGQVKAREQCGQLTRQAIRLIKSLQIDSSELVDTLQTYFS